MSEYTIFLIGGQFDMTKMKVLGRRERIELMEAPSDLSLSRTLGPESEPVMCNILTYRLVGDTPKGVLIYEIEDK
jgi:hypothetical protein